MKKAKDLRNRLDRLDREQLALEAELAALGDAGTFRGRLLLREGPRGHTG